MLFANVYGDRFIPSSYLNDLSVNGFWFYDWPEILRDRLVGVSRKLNGRAICAAKNGRSVIVR
jgi:hypothetical protein